MRPNSLLAIAAATALWLGTTGASTANEGARIAVLNWGLAQTLLGLGIEPVAIANMPGYRKWVAHPPLPDGAVDIGRRIEPNMTVLAGAQPDLILTSNYYNRGLERLRGVAPTETLRIYQPDTRALDRAFVVADELASRLDRGDALAAMRARLERAVAGLRARTEPGETVYVVRFRDGGHIQVFGDGGLFDGVLERAGLANAWQGASNYWGFAMVPIERLDARADHLVVIEPVKRRAEQLMADSPIWRALPAVRHGRVHRLEPIWSFGGVPAATRFAERLAEAIDDAR